MRGTRNPEISRPHTLVSQTGQALHKHRLKVKHKMLTYWNILDFAIFSNFWATFWVEYNPHRTFLEVGFASPAVPELLTRLFCWEGKETIRTGTVFRHLCFLCKENVTKKCDPPKSVNKKLANLNQTESLFCMSGRLCAHLLSLRAYKIFDHVKKLPL